MVKPAGDSYRAVLARAVGDLPVEHQQVLQLRFIEECTGAEVARILRMSEFDAELLYHAALHELRYHLRRKRIMITLQQFAGAIGCTLMTAEPWHEPFLAAMAERNICAPVRQAAFLAQVGHESASLSHLEENLNYSGQRLTEVWPARFPSLDRAFFYEHAPERLANLVYANRMGNGGYESGDGWRYHGRGPIQLTGATNYRRCGVALNLPLIEQPELLLEPKHGARAAAWFWEDRGCNACADSVEAVTKLVNGGDTGLADRQARFDHAMLVLA